MEHKICKCCVMDDTDPDIRFYGENGCSNCKSARKIYNNAKNSKSTLEDIVNQIKKTRRKGNKYDCVIGISGGIDSAYLAYLVKINNLRPLAVHLDNGWNSKLSVHNIKQLVDKLDIDLKTYKIVWEEMRDLQLAFLKASVPDCEIPTDHAIVALLYMIADKYKIKYIIDGWNASSESVLPTHWSHGHDDWNYIKSIHKEFGTKRIRSFPHFSKLSLFYYNEVKGIERVHMLNYVDYNKENAKEILKKKYKWKDYGEKHSESFYTKFYQEYILPNKFGYDKRKMHYSSLIVSGQITREQALANLNKPIYEEEQMKDDIKYFLKKMEIDTDTFKKLMILPNRTYWDYKNSENCFIDKIFYK